MSKHTPGTWTASCDRDDIDEANVILAGDTVIAYVFESPELRKRHRHGKIEGPGSTAGPDTMDEVDANGRLIAAAPDLLEACQGVLFWDNQNLGSIVQLDLAIEAIRAAVAKAQGEAGNG